VKPSGPGIIIVVLLLFTMTISAFWSLFTVRETEKALVLWLGKPVRLVAEPGIHFKVPVVERAVIFDMRVLSFSGPQGRPEKVLTLDRKTVLIFYDVQYRIIDPLRFYQTMHNQEHFVTRLTPIVESNLREVLGRKSMEQILTADKADLIAEITKRVALATKDFGVTVLEVRLKLPT